MLIKRRRFSRLVVAAATLFVPMAGAEPGVPVQTSADAFEGEFVPARRKDQRQTTPGHILTPAAANIPGIGFTYGVLGSLFNIRESETDLLGFRFFGDLAGSGLGLLDLPLGTEDLTLNLFWNSFSKAGIESNRRGINSRRDDRKLVELDNLGVYVAQINWRLFARRLQLLAGANQQTSRLHAVRDKDGVLLTQGGHNRERVFNRSLGAFLDLTDDRADPRRGGSFEVYRYDRPPAGGAEARQYQMEYNALGYLPVGKFSTWVFNLYRSDAIVTRPGELNVDKVKESLNFNCDGVGDAGRQQACQETETQFTNETLAAHRYGTAPGLGGTQRLRSYVTSRFYAAHTLSFGSEFRWNLTEEFTPFNIFVASGVRTGVQLAAFAEGGTVADLPEDLTKDFRYSEGLGVRFILASGFVVRLDLAHGDEGTQPTLIFQYPWSVF